MNNYSFYMFVGFMLMFLAYNYVNSALVDQQQNVKGAQGAHDNNSENNDNGPGGDGVF